MSLGGAIPSTARTLISIRPISVAFGSIMLFEVFVEEVTFNDNGSVKTRTPANLTDGGGTVLTWSMIECGKSAPLKVLSSTISGEIDHVLPQSTAENTGRSIITIDDTATSFPPGAHYEHDVWGTFPDGRRQPVIDVSPFEIRRSATKF